MWFPSPSRAQDPLPGSSPQPAAGIVLQCLTVACSSRSFEGGGEDWLLELEASGNCCWFPVSSGEDKSLERLDLP